MKHGDLFRLSIYCSLLILLLTGCATQSQETQVEISPTIASLPPSPSPQPTETIIEGTLVTSLDQIVGIWLGETKPGATLVMLIQPEGIMKLASSIEYLIDGKSDTYLVWVEDNQVFFDFPLFCSEGIGIYEAIISPGGELDFTMIDDPCTYRISRIDKSMPEEVQQYDVRYRLLKYQPSED